jgi:CRP-like cAMP-binding protein
MALRKSRPIIDWKTLIAKISRVKDPVEYGANCKIYQQGQSADSLLYLRRGRVKLTVVSKHGKEATLAILRAGEFFGEGCLAGQRARMATATAMTACTLNELEKPLMRRILHERHEISELFVSHLLSRNLRYEADLVGRFVSSSERRLAQILLLLSRFGQERGSDPVAAKVSQTDLARLIGISRSRVSQFMNTFRKLGFIEYDDNGGLIVQSGLLGVVLHD